MDRYSVAMEHLVNSTRGGKEVYDAWNDPTIHEDGCLFQYCSRNGQSYYKNSVGMGEWCGCLTQVKGGDSSACTPELTLEIQADSRLHPHIRTLVDEFDVAESEVDKLALLQPYAEWQRKMDATIRQPKEDTRVIQV